MNIFQKRDREKELLKEYHKHLDLLNKYVAEYNGLKKTLRDLLARYKRQSSLLKSKIDTLHDAKKQVAGAKNILDFFSKYKTMSKEEFENFNLYNELNAKVKILKEKLQKGYDIFYAYDDNEVTTYQFAYDKSSNVSSYKIFSQADKNKLQKEIDDLELKLKSFSEDQVYFFENKIKWSYDIEKRIIRLQEREEAFANIKDSTINYLDNMRNTKKECKKVDEQINLLVSTKLNAEKEKLQQIFSKLSSKNQKAIEKKQTEINDELQK